MRRGGAPPGTVLGLVVGGGDAVVGEDANHLPTLRRGVLLRRLDLALDADRGFLGDADAGVDDGASPMWA